MQQHIAQDKTDYARWLGYQYSRRVMVQNGLVISHRNADWFVFCDLLREQHADAKQFNLEEYAVSDQNGYYVFYTDDYREAMNYMDEINESLAENDIEGQAAIMRRVKDTGGYELYF